MRRLSVLFICFPWLAGACSCVYPNQPNAREAAYAVFDGVVTDVHYFKSEQDGRTLVTFDISRSWKGSVGSTIKVHAEERALMCDSYVFELGHRYIVYAIQQDRGGLG